MSWADIVADTDIELVQKQLEHLHERQNALVDAVNRLGANVQWIIDNVQGIFQMFQSPAFMANLPAMMSGMGDPSALLDRAQEKTLAKQGDIPDE